jgi:hypothetical protein
LMLIHPILDVSPLPLGLEPFTLTLDLILGP